MEIHIGGNKTKKNLFYNPSEKLSSESIFENYYKLLDYYTAEKKKLIDTSINLKIANDILSQDFISEGHRYLIVELKEITRRHLQLLDNLKQFLGDVKSIIENISELNRKGLQIYETSDAIDEYILEFYNMRKKYVSVSFFDGSITILPHESPKACNNCNNRDDFVLEDDGKVCQQCFSTTTPITSNSNYIDSKRINISAPYKYNRTNNFKEYLNHFQRNHTILGAMHEKLTDEFEAFSSQYDTLNSTENKKKRNFINTRFVLYQLLMKNNIDCNFDEFIKPKTERIVKKPRLDCPVYNRNEDICRKIFAILGWTYTEIVH